MSMIEGEGMGIEQIPFMADFLPFESLWAGNNPPYPSEFSARWELRKLRSELAQANAVAIHRGRIHIHPLRFAKVAEQAAIRKFNGAIEPHSQG